MEHGHEGVAVFETGIRQFRMAMGMVWGYRIDPQNSAVRLESEKVTFPASVCAVSRRLLGAR